MCVHLYFATIEIPFRAIQARIDNIAIVLWVRISLEATMTNVLVLNHEEIDSLLTIPEAIESVEAAYVAKENETGTLFPVISHEFSSGSGELDIKSGHLRTSRVYGIKLVSWFAENQDFSLPEKYATSLLFDDRTGEPLALLNASGLTNMRTGAAAAISMKYLAREDSKALLMVGMGALSPYLVAAAFFAMPSLDTVYLYNPHGIEKAQQREPEFTDKLRKLLIPLKDKKYTISIIENLPETVAKSDIIVTATPSRIPLLMADWLKPGTHICAIGSDLRGKQELDSFILNKAVIYVDDKNQASDIGETEIPLRHGLIRLDSIKEISELIVAKERGRKTEEEITVFDATGIALQDLSISKRIYDLAVRANIGISVGL